MTLTVEYWAGSEQDRGYLLRFPLEQLGNAIALCGWMLTNNLKKTPEVQAELQRLEAKPFLEVPDGYNWFKQFATPLSECS